MISFRFLERGIEAELARQRGLIGAGGRVEQETLHFHPEDGSLHPLRSKEEAHDYRYFPEPDLVAIAPTEAMLREARESLPELPAARAERYREQLRLPEDVAALLAADPQTAEYFEATSKQAEAVEARIVANWGTGELAAALRQEGGEGNRLSREKRNLECRKVGGNTSSPWTMEITAKAVRAARRITVSRFLVRARPCCAVQKKSARSALRLEMGGRLFGRAFLTRGRRSGGLMRNRPPHYWRSRRCFDWPLGVG